MAQRRRPAKILKMCRYAVVVGEPTEVLLDPAWLQRHRPLVLILTRGEDPNTLDLVSRRLQELGARLGTMLGRLTNQQLSVALDRGNHSLFKGLALELADCFLREPLDQVFVGSGRRLDQAALVSRWLVDAAVQLSWAHRPQLQIQAYPAAMAEEVAPVPFSSPVAESRLLAVRDALRAFVQGDLAWAA